MRLFKTLVALMFVALGVVFGALNRQSVVIDVWWKTLETRLGLTLISVLLLGALLGGLVVTAGVVWPLRRRLRQTGNAGSGPEMPATNRADAP
jgi:putative membrane protein